MQTKESNTPTNQVVKESPEPQNKTDSPITDAYTRKQINLSSKNNEDLGRSQSY